MKKKLSRQEKIYYFSEEAFSLFEHWKVGGYRLLKVLKDTDRSYVALLEIEGRKFIYKEPREKKHRKWQRFLSIFRGSESRREGLQMLEIEKKGFLGPKFQFAYERKWASMTIYSFLVYSYIDAEEMTVHKAEQAFAYLKKIHDAGFLHGDSQLSNFLMDGEDIYLIDSKFQKNKYGALGSAYENYYFELSCPNCSFLTDRSHWAYKIAKKWKDLKEWWVKIKTKRRERK